MTSSETDRPPTGTELAERLRSAAAGLAGLRGQIDAGEPWPLATRFDHSDEAAWGPREVLAHVAEMIRYWAGEAERMIDSGRRGRAWIPFGRTAEDATRIAIIGRDRELPASELLGRIEADAGRLADRLEALTPAELTFRGRHPTRGELTVAGSIERFVVSHLEEHVRQLDGVLPGS